MTRLDWLLASVTLLALIGALTLIDPLIAQPNRYQWLYDRFGKIKVLLSAYEDGPW